MGNIKKFEDFLDKMQGLLDNAKKQGHIIVRVEDIENTFPELKESESEDERIRKDILGFVKDVLDNKPHLTPRTNQLESWIAWLEKQVEQKPEEVDNLHNYLYGEQKPAWSEEDEAVLDALIRRLEGEDIHVSPHLAVKCLKSLKGRVLPQRKQEWSEEDEQITLSIEQVMNCASLLNVVPEKIDKIRTWLKSLKDRYTWKPSSIQMECLYDAINHYHTNGYPASKLKELYEQMSNIYKL